VILSDHPYHMPEVEIALHTSMRPSKQYALIWSRVDLVRKLITISKSKNGNTRHVPLNAIALAAFQKLFARSSGQGRVFVNIQGEPLKGYKHWFDPALREAGIRFFTWCCLRHTLPSRLVMAGVDLRTVAELMGHKTIQIRCDTHIWRLLTNWLLSKGLQRGGRWIDQTDTKLAPSLIENASERVPLRGERDTSIFEQESGVVRKASFLSAFLLD
jgi:hypothetical protein